MPREDRMTMKRLTLAVAALLVITAVNAEIYQWKDENGKTIISDKPPVGAARLPLKVEKDAPAANAASQKTPADREMEFRKRQKESQESADKSQKEQAAAADKRENCEKAGRYVQSLESGERIALRDDKGERYYMEDAQRQQEIAKAKQNMQAACK
jgi:type IV secretory pathway VirB10-like protein